nr:ABC transporter substrate-binding protein [Ephemeroptericola cinctiostellae]
MAVILGLSGCGPAKTESVVAKKVAPADAVRVASKIDTEGALLGNMIILLLENKGIPTVNKVQLGATKIVRYALTSGEIDIYPEYTGSGAFIFNDEKNLAWKNPKEAYDLVKKLDYDKNKLVWLQAAPANNTWAIAVRSDLAEAHHLKTLEDLKQYLDSGGPFKMAASSEFIERGDALPLFEKAYGFKLKQNQFLSLAGGDTTVFIKAAAEQTSGVNAALAYGTDGAIASMGLVVLDDSKTAQPVFEPAPVIREEALKKHPEIADILNPVFASLDLKTLQKLNGQIAFEGRDAKTVASDYLKSQGFLK